MNRKLILLLCIYSNLLVYPATVSAAAGEFNFGVIAHPFQTVADEAALRTAIKDTDAADLAFVVANGIKSNLEPCSDKIYSRRKTLFSSAQNGLIVSLAASDWSDCKNSRGKSAAVERLNRIRDLFFTGEFSFGASKIPLLRQSASPRFRSYGENARWELNNMMFATINLPANNNNYLAAAGRNNEFEDRLIADQEWLQRMVSYAVYKKLTGIVLFSDGNPLAPPATQNNKRDGFLEIRRKIIALAAKFSGKILIIHSQSSSSRSTQDAIQWHGNLGELGVTSGWLNITVSPSSPALFSIGDNASDVDNTRQ